MTAGKEREVCMWNKHGENEWLVFVMGECVGLSTRDEPLNLMRCHNCKKPL